MTAHPATVPAEMTETDRLLERNKRYAATFAGRDLPPQPARRVAIVTCMDARIDPAHVLGLDEGDAHVIRNAGGVISDEEIRSLAISQHMLGTDEVVVIQHTQCGMLAFTDEEFADRLKQDAGDRPAWPARTISDLDDNLRTSIRQIRENPFLQHRERVRGFIYDIETGLLREVS